MLDEQLLRKVRNEQFFGMVRCSIYVPPEDYIKWADLPPIFKNAHVSLEDIGPHMATWARMNKQLEAPRRTLISSYGSNDIMIGTPLLKWYLEHGLVVDRVHEA